MKEKFKSFCNHLANDEINESLQNAHRLLRSQYSENKVSFYDFIDKMQSYNKILYQFAEYLKDTGISKIEIIDSNVIYTTKCENLKIIFNGKDRRGVPFEMLNWGSYENPEQVLLSSILTDGMTMFDIGANIGWYSLLWGKQFRNSCIHAFEPIEENYTYLNANVVLNGLKNVKLHNFGLSDRNEDASFHFYSVGSCLASMKNILGYDKAKEIKCPVRRLDDTVKNLHINQIDFIKCDVEGAELNVIKGGTKTIVMFLPVIVLELFHEWSNSFNYHPDEAIKFMCEMGYRAFLPLKGGVEEVHNYLSSDFDRQNYFFLHQDKHRELISRLIALAKT